MTRRLALLGAGGHAKVVADAALAAGWDQVTFFADSPCTANARWPVVGTSDDLFAQCDEFDGLVVAIGNCSIRMAKHQWLRSAGARMATVIHPRACVSPFASIGAGCVVMPGSVLNVDCSIGEACIINTSATVDHDCVLADGVHVAPGAHLSGNVVVGERSWIGVGASIRQGVRIGCGVVVGAGAAVVGPVDDGLTVMGVPAKPR